jgi:hypothetical protein
MKGDHLPVGYPTLRRCSRETTKFGGIPSSHCSGDERNRDFRVAFFGLGLVVFPESAMPYKSDID